MKCYLICPECAYTTADLNRKFCEYCGTKLRISYVPIQ